MEHHKFKKPVAAGALVAIAVILMTVGITSPASALQGAVTSVDQIGLPAQGYTLREDPVVFPYNLDTEIHRVVTWQKSGIAQRVTVRQQWTYEPVTNFHGSCEAFTHSNLGGTVCVQQNDATAIWVFAYHGRGMASILLETRGNTDPETTVTNLQNKVREFAVAAGVWGAHGNIKAPDPEPDPVKNKVTKPREGAKIIKGTSNPGAKVTVKVGNKSYKTTVKKNGKWSVKVPGLKSKQKVTITITKEGMKTKSISIRV